MCGRFTQTYSWREIHDFLNVFGLPQNLRAHYKIAPTMDADVVMAQGGERILARMRWGLCPAW